MSNFSLIAYVMVKMKPGTSREIVGSRKVRGVKMANSVFGRFDAVLVISAKDLEDLSKTIYEVVEKHPDVIHTECMVALPYEPEKPRPPQETYSVISFHCPSCHALNEQGSPFCQFCGFLFPRAPEKTSTVP